MIDRHHRWDSVALAASGIITSRQIYVRVMSAAGLYLSTDDHAILVRP
jgi:hypothetical protein